MEEVAQALSNAYSRGKSHAIAVIAEGASYRTADLSNYLTNERSVGFEIRLIILGHIVRGGSPTAFDRLLATRMGVKAVELLLDGQTGLMVGLDGRDMVGIPIKDATGTMRPLNESFFAMHNFLSR
jgi:6-phosphofructokinase 1